MIKDEDIVTPDAAGESDELPFQAFFEILKQHGFELTVGQIIDAHQVIRRYSDWVKDEEEYFPLLVSIFAHNEDEQELFRELFYDHFIYNVTQKTVTTQDKKPVTQKLRDHWKHLVIIYGLIGLACFSLIVYTYRQSTGTPPLNISVSLERGGNKDLYVDDSSYFAVRAGEKLELAVNYQPRKTTSGASLTLHRKFAWGDGSQSDTISSHSYSQPGNYALFAYITVTNETDTVFNTIISKRVHVGNKEMRLRIDYDGSSNIPVNTEITLDAIVDEKHPPDSIRWMQDETLLDSGASYQAELTSPGQYMFQCRAYYGPTENACILEQRIGFTVFAEKKEVDTVGQPPMPPIKPAEKIKEDGLKTFNYTPLFRLYGILAIIFFFLTIGFIILRERELIRLGNLKKNADQNIPGLSKSAKPLKTPAFLPFRSRHYSIAQQSEIGQAAKLMRKRVNDNSRFLHIGQTISKTISNGGMLEPVTAFRTRPVEYLVLIDEGGGTDNQLVNLFEYLCTVLKKQNIIIDKYYYRRRPGRCFNNYFPGGISLEKLYSRHERHILLVLGDARTIADATGHSLAPEYADDLHRWQYRALLTPRCFPDWGRLEKEILSQEIPVFPADIEGMLLMAEYFAAADNKPDIIARLNLQQSRFYKTAGIDFNSIAQLAAYCHGAAWAQKIERGRPVNVLLQWLAASVIYPKARWEIIVAMGRAILDKYNCATELNYSNLLRIARIPWMQEGTCPPATRLELLKMLSNDNERIARELLLQLLEEIPAAAIEKDANIAAEKEIQQLINEFSLYAYDPVYYSEYKKSKYRFEKLWEAGTLEGSTEAEYFDNPDTGWETLIKLRSASGGNEKQTADINSYFAGTRAEENILSKLYLWLSLISLFVLVSSLFAIMILYQWKNGTDAGLSHLP